MTETIATVMDATKQEKKGKRQGYEMLKGLAKHVVLWDICTLWEEVLL